MGSLGQQIREDAWQEGVEKGVERGIEIGKSRGIEIGKLNALAQLVKQNTVPMEVAAGIMNMSVETFQRKISALVL